MPPATRSVPHGLAGDDGSSRFDRDQPIVTELGRAGARCVSPVSLRLPYCGLTPTYDPATLMVLQNSSLSIENDFENISSAVARSPFRL